MQIEWRSPDTEPYLSRQIAEWPGLRVHRAHVLAGRMLEHVSDVHEINIALSGSLTTQKICPTGRCVTTNNTGGNLCITPAGQPVSARWDGPLDNLGIFLNAGFVSTTAAENGFSPEVEFIEIFKGEDPLIQNIGLTLLETSAKGDPHGRLFADSLSQTLTLHMLTNYTNASKATAVSTGGLSGYRLNRVIEFINENLDRDLPLADIAKAADLSPFHFARAFRRSTGKTPQQYLMQQRMERAKLLLARPDLPIVEVSLRTGFKNQSHFTSLFRKHTSLTPKLWRDLKTA